MTVVSVLFLLIACASETGADIGLGGRSDDTGAADPGADDSGVDESGTGGADDGPSPEEYEYPGDEASTLSWDEDAAVAAVQGLLADLRTYNATPVVAAYTRAMTSASGDCPQRTRDGDDERWIAHCSTTAGASFDGYAQVDALVDQPEGGAVWDGAFYYLAAVIRTTDGYQLDGGGSARIQEGEGSDGQSTYQAWYSFLQGTLRWNGPGSAGTWIVGEVTPNLGLNARYYPSSGTRTLTVDGAVALDDPYLTAVTFTDIRVTREQRGAECELEPKGDMALRDAAGAWYEVAFDTAEGMDPGACDGCGTVSLNGDVVGRICLDFGDLTDWTTAPW